MPLEDVSDGIVLENVEGLDPVKATLVTSKLAKMRGSQYHASSSEDRNIKLRLLLEPDHVTTTVADVRKRIYNFFMPEAPVDLTFRDSTGLDFGISGRVESCETPLFTKDPAVDVSIMCFDPDFFLLDEDGFHDVTLVPGYSVNDATTFDINYLGTVKTGIEFHLMPDRAVTQFTIYNELPDGSNNNLDFAANLEAFDTLVIKTTPGEKEVTQYRDNTVFATPLYGVLAQSSWTELQPGINKLRIYADGAPLQYLLSYPTRFGGL